MTVSPANELPALVGKNAGATLAICNLQETPLDSLAGLRVFSATNNLMIKVMEKLGIPIPPFVLQRRLVVQLEPKDTGGYTMGFRGIDTDGTPVSFLRSVKLEYNRRVAVSEPFTIAIRGDLDLDVQLKLRLEFTGHYGEPELEINHHYRGVGVAETVYVLELDPLRTQWTVKEETS